MHERCAQSEQRVVEARVITIKTRVFDLCGRPDERDVTRNCPLGVSARPGLQFIVSYEQPRSYTIGQTPPIVFEQPEIFRMELRHPYDGSKCSGRTLEITGQEVTCRVWVGEEMPDSDFGVHVIESREVRIKPQLLLVFSTLLSESLEIGGAQFED